MHLPPFDTNKRLLRGNLHGHSTHSDGEYSPEQVASIYRNLGYDFTCISDHLWIDERYSARHVLDASALDDDNFITIASAEIHCLGKLYDQDNLWHILANGLPLDFVVASETETAPELVQRAVDTGAYVTIAHPEWYSMTCDEALSVSHAHGVEIYNYASTMSTMRGSGIAISDFLLNNGKKPTFIASDDSHFQIADAGGGWVMVAAESLNAGAIIDALKSGHHYASTGAEFHDIIFNESVLEVHCSPSESITVVGKGHLSQNHNGQNLTYACFDLSRFASDWFRISIRDDVGRCAWSNPFWQADYKG